ncbi:MAG: M48 family metalloprotease [Leptolyngbyaceae cyanobacterium T60_A2020_046]|nr:M48 family metalloprotease [Leptolyngbyaceae cyanobacterium T60_A2020_046]
MRSYHRFIAGSLIGFLLSAWLGSGWGWNYRAIAADPDAIAASSTHPVELAQDSADGLQEEDAPSADPSPEGANPEATNHPDTLDLPDFEPRLPAEERPPDDLMQGELESQPSETEESEETKLSKEQQILITADNHYLAGDRAAAEALYRQVKDAAWEAEPTPLRPEPILNAEDLPPAAAVYWREAQQGAEQGLAHRTQVPLALLVREYPEFIPAQVFYARYLIEQGRAEEADANLDQVLMLYPSQPALLRAQVEVKMAREQWIEASIAARQFVLLNPDHPRSEEMLALAEQNLDRFRAQTNSNITRNFVGNLVTGVAGVLLTGGLVGPVTAVNSAVLLLQGEDALGARIAEQARAALPMVSDREVTTYLDDIGQKLAQLAGRNEFKYEFYVVDDDALNAFALPGGKIFVNSGAILKTRSEAELAGLVAHEISHAVLSHGFQMVTNGNLLSSLASFIPVPAVANIATGLAVTGYSRQMERQADVLGTQILATGGYAADGLHNLMVTLESEVGDRGGVQWLASHPAPSERVAYLKQLVETGGYNRYAYEGVEPHLAVQQRLAQRDRDQRHRTTVEKRNRVENSEATPANRPVPQEDTPAR